MLELELVFIISSNIIGNKKTKPDKHSKISYEGRKKQPFAESLLSTGYYVHV